MNRTAHRWLLLLLLACLLQGCAALRMGYRHADTLVAWRADEYFDLDENQKREFNARLAELLKWHREAQLPEYAAFFSSAITRARPELKYADIRWFVDGFEERYRILVRRGIGDATDMLAILKPEQLTALQNQWTKDNRKFVRENGVGESAAERKRLRLKRTIDQIDDWTGALTGEQVEKISQLLDQVPSTVDLRYKDRVRRQNEFLELLKLRHNKQDFQPRLQAFLLDWESGRAPEYAQLAAVALEKRIQMYMAVEKLLTADQRQAALQRMQNYVDDFNYLSQRGA